jgi:hypothetical protein
MQVLYYYYYLFYKKIGLDANPNLAARLALTFLEALFIRAVANALFAYLFCHILPLYIEIGLIAFFLFINTYIYFTPAKEVEIIKLKPVFLNRPNLSIVISILFFLANVSTLYWLSGYLDSIIKTCNR